MPSARWTFLIASGSFMAGCSGSAELTLPDSGSAPLNTIVQITSSSSPEAGVSDDGASSPEADVVDAGSSSPDAGTPDDSSSSPDASAGDAGSSSTEAVAADAMCPSPFTACGGDPTGTWQVAASCLAPSPAPSAVGMCAGVSFVGTDLQSWTGGVPSLNPRLAEGALDQGSVTFNADHSYESAIGGSTEGTYHFESSCLGVYHAHDCSALASTLQGMLPPNYLGLTCTADDGCDCSFRFVTVWGDEGTWTVSGTTLTLNSSVQAASQEADLCAGGASLQISAPAGASLFGAKLQSIWLTQDAVVSP
jgi:hypothetical protein